MSINSAVRWPQISRTERFRGHWVALDNCRYDQVTRQPTEGDVVDSDENLAELCRRMRESGRSSCSVLFCSGDVFVEQHGPTPPPSQHRDDSPASRAGGSR